VEDLFSAVIVIIGVIASIVSSVNKNKKKQQAAKTPYASPILSSADPKPAAAPRAEQVSMSSMLPPREEPPQVAQPTVHTHLEPDCEEHDAVGSMNIQSPEGKDPCHEEQLTLERRPIALAEESPAGLTFDWSGDAMVKAFVMQEVLTRPSQRRAR